MCSKVSKAQKQWIFKIVYSYELSFLVIYRSAISAWISCPCMNLLGWVCRATKPEKFCGIHILCPFTQNRGHTGTLEMVTFVGNNTIGKSVADSKLNWTDFFYQTKDTLKSLCLSNTWKKLASYSFLHQVQSSKRAQRVYDQYEHHSQECVDRQIKKNFAYKIVHAFTPRVFMTFIYKISYLSYGMHFLTFRFYCLLKSRFKPLPTLLPIL